MIGISGPDSPSEGIQSQTTQPTEGAVLAALGLTILAPAAAVPAGVEILYTPLYTSSEVVDEGASLTETTQVTLEQAIAPEQSGGEVYLPMVQQDSDLAVAEAIVPDVEPIQETAINTSTLPVQENNGVSVYRLWHLAADGLMAATSDVITSTDEGQDPAHPQFASPVFMIVDVSDLVTHGVNMNLLDLWTRPDESQDWRPVPFARYDEKRQSWVAWLNHFSDFAIGIAPAANGELLPSMKGYTVDNQTGSVNFSYPINTPTGLGGLNPNLSLNYSTQTVNDLYVSMGNDSSQDIQANNVGYGWSLGGMNSIRKFRNPENHNEVFYSLTLNGKSYDIRPIAGQSGKYDTDPVSFMAIKFTHTATNSEWEIKTPDGTLYEFGGAYDTNWPSSVAERDTQVEMNINVVNSVRTREVSAWHLRRVEDTAGNYMNYIVTTQRGNITNGACLPQGVSASDPDDDPLRWYTKSARLKEMAYSGNTGKYGSSVSLNLRVTFEYDTRSDTNITEDCQPRVTGLRLQKISALARKTDSSGWHVIRRYELQHSYAAAGSQGGSYIRHLLLQSINEYGKDSGTTTLNTHSFTYEKLNGSNGDTEYNIHLKTADNGYGGKVTYTYTNSTIDCPDSDPCQDNKIRLATKMQLEDGQGNYYITTFAYNEPHIRLEQGRLLYMGTNYSSSNVYKPTTNPTGTLSLARFEEYNFHRGDWSNPVAAEGKLGSMIIRDHGGTGNIAYYRFAYYWESFVRDAPNNQWDLVTFNFVAPIWTRLVRSSEWVGGPNQGSARQKRYFYETNYNNNFGNVIRVDEYSHPESDVAVTIDEWKYTYEANDPLVVFLRSTKTEYFPNTGWPSNATAPYIIDRPGRVIIENSSNVCLSENRIVYADPDIAYQNRGGIYNAPPATALVIKTEQVISGCPYTSPTPGYRQDPNLIVIAYSIDEYGNELTRTSNDLSAGHITIATAYDSFYHLFPIERYNTATPTLIANARYYGVDGVAVDSTRGFWGAMSETCEINNICSRFGYDQFGRHIHQWDRQVEGNGWPTDANATVRWGYRKAGNVNFPGQTTYIVTEWRAPRCEGNFVRRHYDGLGQLVIEQKSYQDYEFEVDGCGDTVNPAYAEGREIITFFKYDALGNQIEATVPRLRVHDNNNTYRYWDPSPNTTDKSLTSYDPLGRVISTFTPNGERTDTTYNGRVTYVIGQGRNNDVNKTLHWQQVNALGYQRHLRIMYWDTRPEPDMWKHHGQLNFTTNALGNVTAVQHTGVDYDTGGTYVVGTNSYTYDQVGRMTSMTDMDMGNWTYSYNRLNQLTRQKDGRGQYTCLYYDDFGRSTGKGYNDTNSTCPGSVASTHSEIYSYGTSGTATGQLTQISLRGSGEYDRKTITYDTVGQIQTETVLYPSAAGSPQFLATYNHDEVSGRLISIRYPADVVHAAGEHVVYHYNGMGLVEAITSNFHTAAIVDQIGYNELGRITSMRYSIGTGDDLYLTRTYYPWVSGTSNDANSRLSEIRVGISTDLDSKLRLSYFYDSFGNIDEIREGNGAGQVTHTFVNDIYNRVRKGTYSNGVIKDYQTTEDGRVYNYEGQTNIYETTHPYAVDRINVGGNTLYYDRDANGNAITREYMNGSTKVTQELVWNGANQLGRVEVNGQKVESYWYDEHGIRVRKHVHAGAVETLYPFPFYQMEGTQPTHFFLLNGQAVALRVGTGVLTGVHHDQVGSVVMTTHNGAIVQDRQYYPYGNKRGGDEFVFEQNYTGQRKDDTGLIYYNARFYDPQLGQFISPDSIIPDPTDYFSYNRYLYGRGNPISNNDPTGHYACAGHDDACFLAQGRTQGGQIVPAQIVNDDDIASIVGEAGFDFQDSPGYGAWSRAEKILALEAAVDLANKLDSGAELDALTTLRGLLGGGATFLRGGDGTDEVAAFVGLGQAIQGAWLGGYNRRVTVLNNTFLNNNGAALPAALVRGTIAHELGHVIDFNSAQGYQALSQGMNLNNIPPAFNIGNRAAGGQRSEIYAELMAQWVYATGPNNPYRDSLGLQFDAMLWADQMFGGLVP